ncbi:MAG: MogA/MoaB family molybdenum cofactor biosynthesis protein [Nitrososphaerota archaeon]
MLASPVHEHESRAPRTLRFALVTVSSSRYAAMREGKPYTDESQGLAAAMISGLGHVVAVRELVDDDIGAVRTVLEKLLESEDLDAIIFIGGTGFSSKDVTIEAVKPFFEKEVEGFGELFRWLSFQEIGAAAILSRAVMGVARGKAIMCLPGSPAAVRLALENFLQALPHLIYIARS